ncbi:MAG: ABC transporter permease [Bacillota bacterium]|jgi:putative ABC transport system permease protein
MSYLVKMAWRNLGRHRGRTMLSLLAIVIGVFVVVIAKGVIDGMVGSWLTYSINLDSGHVRIVQPEYRLKERVLSLSYPVGNDETPADEIIHKIRSLPGVHVATGRIRFGMMLAAQETQEAVVGIGVDFAQEERAIRLSQFVRGRGATGDTSHDAGRLPEPGTREILLGRDLMAKLGVEVGDRVNALFSTSFGSLRIATFRVSGKMASGLRMLDESTAYVPLDVAMGLLDMDGSVTEIVVFGKSAGLASKLQAQIARALRGLAVVPWNEHNELIGFVSQAKAIYTVIYIFLVVLASFVVFNTQLMVVSERTREIGMLSALGLSPESVRRLFTIEGAILAVAGSAGGTLLGGVFNLWFGRVGIDLTGITQAMSSEILLTPRLYPVADYRVLLYSFLLGVAVTMTAIYIPARAAGALEPTQALRVV